MRKYAMMFTSDRAEVYHCVAWHSWDEPGDAHWAYFDDRDECKEFAQKKQEGMARYIWMLEKGVYSRNIVSWMYWWWHGDHVEAGRVPDLGYSVPEDREWSYVVQYRPLDPARIAIT
jgi:hypothetical protein